MTEPYPQTPDDSIAWLNDRAYNTENERLKKDNRMLIEMVDRLKAENSKLKEAKT